MKFENPAYAKYFLVKEMLQTVDIVRNFDVSKTKLIAEVINSGRKLLLTGEGSSRLFPGKNAVRKSLEAGMKLSVFTEASRQAALYDLSGFSVFSASNSGRTKEVIELVKKLAAAGNKSRFALTANAHTQLEDECTQTFLLNCGSEDAVAATKSVVEQALFYESILWNIQGRNMQDKMTILADTIKEVLSMPIPADIINIAANAPTIYFAGYNDGVAEELTLKTNEITRCKSDYLEGTYAVHGVEEVMEKEDIVFVIDPIEEEISKFKEVLIDGVGLTVVAIADKPTPFPTILTPALGDLSAYVYLCAGWNLLVEIGLAKNINLDKPERARKVGNEFIG